MTIVRKTLRTYRFLDKDPVVDELRTLVQEQGLYSRKNMGKLAALASLSPGTLHNMFFGDTRRPQNATVMALGTSLGYVRIWQAARKLNFEEELVFARAWNKKEKARLAKARGTAPRKRRAKKRRVA